MYAVVMFLYTVCMELTMAAVEAGLEKSLLSGLKWYSLALKENVSVSVEQKEVIRNIVVLKNDTNFLPGLASH